MGGILTVRQASNRLFDQDLEKKVRDGFPLITKVKTLEGMKQMRLIGMTASNIEWEGIPIGFHNKLSLFYECVASQDLYPHIEKRLIQEGIFKLADLKNYTKKPLDDHEYKQITIGLHEDSVRLYLRVYDPEVILIE